MIQISNLTKIFKSKNRTNCHALKGINLTFPNSGLVFVVGQSGSGKSTLLSLIGGLDNATSGEIIINDTNIIKLNEKKLAQFRNNEIGFIFQDYHLIEDLTIKDNIKIVLDLKNSSEQNRINDILKSLGLSDYSNRYPYELSGGQQQRVAIARALIKNPSIILADEPTGNLDSHTAKQVLDILKEISKTKLVIIVSHNAFDARNYADRIIELSDGNVCKNLVKDNNFNNNVEIKDGTLFLPFSRILTAEEEEFINKNSNKYTKIQQKLDPFKEIDNKVDYEKIKNSSASSHFKLKSRLNLSLKINKKRFITTSIYALIISCLLTVFGFSQLIAYFDSSKALHEGMKEQNISSVEILKKEDPKGVMDINNKFMVPIIEDEKEQFLNCNYKGNIFDVLDYTFSSNDTKCAMEDFKQTMSNEYFYRSESFGTAIVNEEFLIDKYGVNNKLVYLAKADEVKEYGIWISDYLADSYIRLMKIDKNYNQLLGSLELKKYYFGEYINGIFKTDYLSRYENLIKLFKSTNKDNYKNRLLEAGFADFQDELVQYLGKAFSFNLNFKKDLINSGELNWVHAGKDYFSYDDNRSINTFQELKSVNKRYYDKELKSHEITLPLKLYNSLVNKKYTLAEAQANFKPIKIKHTAYYDCDSLENYKVKENELTLVAVLEDSASPYVSIEYLKELQETFIMQIGYIFDNINDPAPIFDLSKKLGYIPNSILGTTLDTMMRAVDSFSGIFTLILIFVFAGVALLLIVYCIKTIKSSYHEIGVLKSLGTPTIDLVRIFSLQFILLTIEILVIYNLFSFFFIGLANKVLIGALMSLTESVFIITQFLFFNPLFNLINSSIIVSITIFTFIILVIKLYKIKPIDILKAKE